MTHEDQLAQSSQGAQQPWEDELLVIARDAITAYIGTGMLPVCHPSHPRLLEPAAVFVTLRTSAVDTNGEGDLRGCVGQVQARLPLCEAVQDAAIQAATADPRFPPVRESELDKLRIEISILSPMTLVKDLDEVEIGRHGLLIDGMGRRGLLLPSVAEQYNWDAQAFLRGLCMKAGLPDGVWPGEATLQSFTVAHFSEQ